MLVFRFITFVCGFFIVAAGLFIKLKIAAAVEVVFVFGAVHIVVDGWGLALVVGAVIIVAFHDWLVFQNGY